MTLVEMLLPLIVFPGLVFISTLSLFTEWIVRKIVARSQNRIGPAYVGPFGILQPFADFLKLFMAKEEVVQMYSSPWLAKLFLSLGIGGIVASTLMLPLSPFRFAAPYDVLVLSYLCTVWPSLSIVLASILYPNPYTYTGVSRLIAMLVVVEPIWIASILVPVVLASHLYNAKYSIYLTSVYAWRLWMESPIVAAAMALAFVSFIVATQAKTMMKPFDIPEAEQELIAGHITEFSGQTLALYNILHDIELTFSALLATYIFLGGPYPYRHLSIAGILVLAIKYLVIVLAISLIRACSARLRIDQGIRAVLYLGGVPAAVALILTLLS